MSKFWYDSYNEASERVSKLAGLVGILEGSLKVILLQTDNPELKRYITEKLAQSEIIFDELYENKTKTS